MKYLTKIALIFILAFFVAGSALADKKGRKLPVGAYIKAAKIEILSGDLQRYENAIFYLDSLFLHYGHHAEALNLMASLYVDYIDKTPGPVDKMPYVKKMVAYVDTLHMTCENKKIDSKFKKDCELYTEKADSVKVKFWREFYNAGIAQLNTLQDLSNDLQTATDSATIAYAEMSFKAHIDSCIANMELAIEVDKKNTDPFIAIGNAFEYKPDYKEAVAWLTKGLPNAENKSLLLQAIAYDYVRMNEYCEAIPYFKDFTELNPEKTDVMYHYSICLNNCQYYDEAYKVYHKIIVFEPYNYDVLSSVGNYFNQLARNASDSSSVYRKLNNEAKSNEYRNLNMAMFDSSAFYFKTLFEQYPDSIFAVEQFAVVNALLGKYDIAAIGFKRLTEIDPTVKDFWTYLGDCYLNLRDFKSAIPAYEKVVELDPNNRNTMERLIDLYSDNKDTAKMNAMQKKLDALK